jgi:hypothetical protein
VRSSRASLPARAEQPLPASAAAARNHATPASLFVLAASALTAAAHPLPRAPIPPPIRAEFLAVGRRQDKIILCSRVHSQDKSYDYMEKVKMVMNSPGWATVTTDKLSLEDGGYMFWVSIDEVRARRRRRAGCPASTARPFPARPAQRP